MNKDFAQALLQNNIITLDGDSVTWNKYVISNMENWPKTLDTENFEILSIGDNYFYGQAAGDWQAMTKFKVELVNGQFELYPFLEPTRQQSAKEVSNIEKEIRGFLPDNSLLEESKSSDTKELNKLFDKFNKDYFDNKLPKVEIRITNKNTPKKGVAGSFNFESGFNFHQSIHSNKNKDEHYKLADLKKSKNKNEVEQRAFDYIVENAYIELPKDIVKKGKYYYASVLLHEMAHEYVEFCTKSNDSDPHGKTFRQTVDAINKKSNNEWRVGYEKVAPELSEEGKVYDERPEGDDD